MSEYMPGALALAGRGAGSGSNLQRVSPMERLKREEAVGVVSSHYWLSVMRQ